MKLKFTQLAENTNTFSSDLLFIKLPQDKHGANCSLMHTHCLWFSSFLPFPLFLGILFKPLKSPWKLGILSSQDNIEV